jgi:4-hydroxybenzoate polyprenyltransferase
MTLDTLRRLGRVSNLPTVWTNALAGAVLAVGGSPNMGRTVLAAVVLTLFYESGMWLNDAFDAAIDARERPSRPIPNGEIDRAAVFAAGGLMLVGGVALSFCIGTAAGFFGIALAATVLLYDWLHKRSVLSPVLMGMTRFLSYLLAAVAVGSITGMVVIGAAGLFAHVVGVTYAAKQEANNRIDQAWPLAVLAVPLTIALWAGAGHAVGLLAAVLLAIVAAMAMRRLFRRARGDVPAAVVTLIAGISLYDAALIGGMGLPVLGLLAVGAFLLTLFLQRVASGT